MRHSALAILMLAALSACASTPLPAGPGTNMPDGSQRILGHHCDGEGGVDALVVFVDMPGEVIVHWTNLNVCGQPA